jgi:hypothetical protein
MCVDDLVRAVVELVKLAECTSDLELLRCSCERFLQKVEQVPQDQSSGEKGLRHITSLARQLGAQLKNLNDCGCSAIVMLQQFHEGRIGTQAKYLVQRLNTQVCCAHTITMHQCQAVYTNTNLTVM